jgi:lia operon protein LiaG
MFKGLKVVVFVVALGLMLGGCYAPSEKTVTTDYEETFSGIEEIVLEGKFLEVSYEGRENSTEVHLNGYVEAPESSGLEIKYRKSGSKLIVEVVGDTEIIGWNFGNRFDGFISLTGPENIKLDFQNGSGSIEVLNVVHEVIDLKVNSGSIKAMGIESTTINLQASSGSITGEALTGKVLAEVNSGSVNLREVEGQVTANASSGSLKLESIDGKVDAKVNSGNIRLSEVKELGQLEASSGSIKAERSGLGPNSNFKANSGSVSIQTNSDLKAFNFNLSATSGSVRVGDQDSSKKLNIDNGASATVEGRVSSGSIKIVSESSESAD